MFKYDEFYCFIYRFTRKNTSDRIKSNIVAKLDKVFTVTEPVLEKLTKQARSLQWNPATRPLPAIQLCHTP